MEPPYKYYRHKRHGKSTLVVTFASSGSKKHPIPPFAMKGVLSDAPVDKLFVRDDRNWYVFGAGPHQSVPALAEWLQEQTCGYEHVHFTGQSMGGYGALLLSLLVPNCNSVVAYAPQTCMEKTKLSSWSDTSRWTTLKHLQTSPTPELLDLYNIAPSHDCNRMVVYPRACPADKKHAYNLVDLPFYNIWSFPSAHHSSFGKKMRDVGVMSGVTKALVGKESGPIRRIVRFFYKHERMLREK